MSSMGSWIVAVVASAGVAAASRVSARSELCRDTDTEYVFHSKDGAGMASI
jgi:hypothetical protein